MSSGIYEIVHTTSGRRYIGQSVDIAKRWKAHRNSLRRGDSGLPRLQNAWNKYGEGAFEFKILCLCAPEHLTFFEQKWFDARKPELNICPAAGSRLGVKCGPESTERSKQRSASMLGNTRWIGKAHTDETRAKQAAAHIGKKHSPERCAANSAGHLGKKRSLESCAKQSATMLGKKRSLEARANISKGRRAANARKRLAAAEVQQAWV